jgi:hypothetical protein
VFIVSSLFYFEWNHFQQGSIPDHEAKFQQMMDLHLVMATTIARQSFQDYVPFSESCLVFISFLLYWLQVAKTARLQKLLAYLFSTTHTKKKLLLPHYHAPPDPMPPLDNLPSPVGGHQRNSRATQIYPSTTLLASRFARVALLFIK